MGTPSSGGVSLVPPGFPPLRGGADPADVVLTGQPWLDSGPLPTLGRTERLYGWGGRYGDESERLGCSLPLSPPGVGTHSWLYMPIIAEGVRKWERLLHERENTIGERQEMSDA